MHMNYAKLSIKTSGYKVHSPYEDRKAFYIDIELEDHKYFFFPHETKYFDPYDMIDKPLIEIKQLLSSIIPSRLPPFEHYVTFCEYCRSSKDGICRRHRSVIDIPIGNVSNLLYEYVFELYKIWDYRRDRTIKIIKMLFNVGSGWEVRGTLMFPKSYNGNSSFDISQGAIQISRPSGLTFKYRINSVSISSATYIISQIRDFIDDILNRKFESLYLYPKVYLYED